MTARRHSRTCRSQATTTSSTPTPTARLLTGHGVEHWLAWPLSDWHADAKAELERRGLLKDAKPHPPAAAQGIPRTRQAPATATRRPTPGKTGHDRQGTSHAPAEGQDEILQRLRKLETWVEVIMRTLATLGLESLLIELDEARGGYHDNAHQP